MRIDPQVMRDHFLSMRESKCLPIVQAITCFVRFVPCPHAQPGSVSATDRAWREYSLLLFCKQSADFGPKLWSGMAFRFDVTPAALVGAAQAVDLNRMGEPHEPLEVPPYGSMDRDAFAPGARWVQELRIE